MSNEMRPSAKKILAIALVLEERGFLASMDGFVKIISGEVDEETKQLDDLPGFGSSTTVSSKKVKMMIHTLVHNGYFAQSYREGDYFLALTQKGKEVGADYRGKLTVGLKKKSKNKCPTIIPLDKNS